MADNTYAELCVVKAAVSGESSQGTRFDPGGGAAAGDDNRQPAHVSYGNQSGRRRFSSWVLQEMSGVRRYSLRSNGEQL